MQVRRSAHCFALGLVAHALLVACGSAASSEGASRSEQSTAASVGDGGSAGSGGSAGLGGSQTTSLGGAGVAIGKSCADQNDCPFPTVCDVTTATCAPPCHLYGSPPEDTRVVPCQAGQVCAYSTPKAPSSCFAPCSVLDSTSCPAGFACSSFGGGMEVCQRAGTAGPGQACVATFTNSGCTPGSVCSGGTCHKFCDANAAEPGCPAGESCRGRVCTEAAGDPAEFGAICHSEGNKYCANDGKAFRGICNDGGVCGALCDNGCPAGQSCDGVSCRSNCDVWSAEPGCPKGQLCGDDQLCAASTRGEAVGFGELCRAYVGCAPDGKAWRGICASDGSEIRCRPRCRSDADCPNDGACQSSGYCL